METKTSQLHDLLQEKLELAFHKQTSTVVLHDIIKIASEHSPIDLAYAASRLPPQARPIIYENLFGIEAKTEFIVNTDTSTRVAVLRHISDEDVKKLIEHMPPDEAVEVLEDISERRFRRVVEMLEASKALRIREIKKHRRNTAGRLMTNEFFAFSMDVTIGEVATHIRDNPGIDLTRQVFVLNPEGELQGTVPARNLIVNPPYLPLRQVMRPVIHKVSPDTLREEVVELVERYKIPALAVVDPHDRLLGVITYEDVLDALEDIADETIANMAGTAEKVGEQEPLMKRFFSRAPWLIVTLCAGLINVGVMSSFQVYAAGLLSFVLLFVPLITGMSGNIGLQSSTVLVRSIALGLLSPGNRTETVIKELIIGLTAGTAFGVLCGVSVYILDIVGVAGTLVSPVSVGIVVGVGLMGSCLAGTLLGVFSPLFFARIGVDPAVAAGPIITAFNDFLSMSIYFLIAMGLGALLF
ncbi:MAG: magnesium transporter [Verrucomicrobia bacterium]|nr:magnesium transporter [Verrucomicrobiota bacterium]